MAAAAQAWVGVIGALVTTIVGLMKYFSARSRRERVAIVGKAFSSTVDGLSATKPTKQLAAAVLLRRFFDPHAEQGASGQPYQREAISVTAALLRTAKEGELQKLLADGLAYADSLAGADLQRCNLTRAYWGPRPRPPVTDGALRMLSSRTWPFSRSGRAESPEDKRSEDKKYVTLTDADLSYADLSGASLRDVEGAGAVFRRATAKRPVFNGAKLQNANFEGAEFQNASFKGAKLPNASFKDATLLDADFTGCDLSGAQFLGAQLKNACFEGAELPGANFAGATDIPASVSSRLNAVGEIQGFPVHPTSAAGARQN